VRPNHQTTNLDFPNLFHQFFSVLAENKLIIGPKLRKKNLFWLCFGPMKSLFSFSTTKIEKHWWKKWGNQDWLFGNLMSGTRKTFIFIEFIHRFVTEFVKL
jgi:hypothetical protein